MKVFSFSALTLALALPLFAPVAMSASPDAFPLAGDTASPAPSGFTGLTDPHRFALSVRMNDVIQPGLFQVNGFGDATQITQGKRWSPEIGAAYYMTSKISVELDTTLGAIKNPTTSLYMPGVPTVPFGYAPSVLDLQYHFDPLMSGQFTPYVGAGATYMRFSGAAEWGRNFFITPNSAWGENLEFGGDYAFDQHWTLNFNARKYFVNTGWYDAWAVEMGLTTGGNRNAVKLDPTVIGLGIGYRF